MQFSELKIDTSIQKALTEEGYKSPTPIQQQAIPVALKGKDILACAQTGTGKTAAFAIPVIHHLNRNKANGKKRPVKCLVLAPTRELALQVDDSFRAYGRYSDIKTAVIFGGVSQKTQTDRLRKGVDVITATPGRLLDLIDQGFIHLDRVETLVLDEADRMLDMGFMNDMKKIMSMIPKKRQSLFFSATMPPEIIEFSNSILEDPVKVSVKPTATAVELIQQAVYFVDRKDKVNLLQLMLQDPDLRSILVFTRTKYGADKLVRTLNKKDHKAEAIHGNKSQRARQRALNNFKNGKIRILVATDIAARGIDVDELNCVVNFDLPNEAETYVHRIGRTGRAGSTGIALSFCSEDEKPYLRSIQKLTGKRIPVIKDHPFHVEKTAEEESEPKGPKRIFSNRNRSNGRGKNNKGNRRKNSSRKKDKYVKS